MRGTGAPIPLDIKLAFEQRLQEIWTRPFRLQRLATADLPLASDWTGGLVWNSTANILTWSNGSGWIQPALSTHVHAASAVTFAPAGSIAATNVQAAIEELDAEKQPLDGDLTSIAALATTPFGRDFLVLTDAPAARTKLALGTAALKNTGTSGDAVPVLNGTATTWAAGSSWSGSVTATARFSNSGGGAYFRGSTAGATINTSAVGIEHDGARGSLFSFNYATATWLPLDIYASAIVMAPSGTTRATVSATGIDVVGEVRGDSLRIDAAPTAAAVAQTHHVPINIDGVTYKLLLAS